MDTLVVPGTDKEGKPVEPLRGLRFYNVTMHGDDYLLVGGFGGLWPTTKQRAACHGDEEQAKQHILAGSHTCGLYLRTDMYDIESWKPISAMCYAWGAVDEWDAGARVEYVQIVSLQIRKAQLKHYFSPDISAKMVTELVESLEKRYKVPVEVV